MTAAYLMLAHDNLAVAGEVAGVLAFQYDDAIIRPKLPGKLALADAGVATQQVQGRIIDMLDELIRIAEQPPG